jgi:hypothetical protein
MVLRRVYNIVITVFVCQSAVSCRTCHRQCKCDRLFSFYCIILDVCYSKPLGAALNVTMDISNGGRIIPHLYPKVNKIQDIPHREHRGQLFSRKPYVRKIP